MSNCAAAISPEDNLSSVLADFGLSSLEIGVYQAALSCGSRPASVIAQRAGLKRGNTYNILQSLIEKGMIQEFVRNGVRHFVAGAPRSLLSILDRREDEIAFQKQRLLKVIPQLEQLRSPLSSLAKVRVYKGLEGIKEIYEDMLTVPNENIYGVLDIAYQSTFCGEASTKWINAFIARRADRNIWWLGIMNRSAETLAALKERRSDKREVRFVDGLDIKVDINIYGTKVAIISTAGEQVGVILENEAIADTLRSMHQRVWELLPSYDAEEC